MLDDLQVQNLKGMLKGYKSGRDYGIKIGTIEGQLDVVGSILTYVSSNQKDGTPGEILKGVVNICQQVLTDIEKKSPSGPNSEFDIG